MELRLTPELAARLSRLAAQQGREVQALAQESIERLVDYDEWFIREVEKGLASADRGETLTHEEVGERLERLIAEKRVTR
jgi:predicted transcriptional regulator